MSRNGLGVYERPAGTTPAPNQVIESAKYNAAINDIVDDLNAARPVTAGGTGDTTEIGAANSLKVVSFGAAQSLNDTQKTQAVANIGGPFAVGGSSVASQTVPEGLAYWSAGDKSPLLLGSAIASSAVNSGTGTITSVAHGLKTGFSVIVTAAVNGLALNTLYRVIRVDADNFKLATTWANAKAGTAVTLTGTAAMSVKQHYDPLKAKYITPTTDISGASGTWVRHGTITPYHAGAVGDGVADDTEAVQNILSVYRGGVASIADGRYKTTLELWTLADKTHVALSHDAEIIHDTPNYIAVNLAHAKCRISGGKGGGFTGPAVYDPGTGASLPTYGVIWATADGCEVDGSRITNVRRIGVGFKDVNRCAVLNTVIDGNMTKPTFPLVTTFHFGVFIDPSNTSGLGKARVKGNEIAGCCTGVSIANYGGGPANARSMIVANNNFEDCWDHCVYSNYTGGGMFTDNTSHRCHTPLAVSGPANIVDGWTVYTEAGTPDERDIAAAVSFRDPVACIARNITIYANGDSVAGQTVIGVDFFNPTSVPMDGNLVDGVRIVCKTGAAQAVRINAAVAHTGNSIRNVYFDGIIRDALGAVAVEGAVGNNVLIDGIQVVQRGGAASYAVSGRMSNSRVSGVQHEIAFNRASGSPTAVYAVALSDSNDTCVTGVNQFNRAGFGQYTNAVGVAEFTAGARNEVSDVKEMIGLATGQTFTPAAPLSGATQMLLNIAGTGAPAFPARAGSFYRRFAGQFWRNTADGNNWTFP